MAIKNFAAALRASLENQEEGYIVSDPEGGEDVVPVIDPSELEGELIAADDAEDHAEAELDEAEEVADAAEGLESILNMVKFEAANGGLTPATARWVRVSMEAYVGTEAVSAGLVPSVESFGGETSREKATASLEANIGEAIKQAYEFIKRLILKAYEWIVEYAGRIFNAAKGLKHRAQQLSSRQLQAGTPKEASIDISSLAPRFSVQGKAPASLTALYQNLGNLMGEVGKLDQVGADAESKLEGAFSKLATVNDEGFEAVKQEVLGGVLAKGNLPGIFKVSEDGKSFSTPVLPGEVYFVAEYGRLGVSVKSVKAESKTEQASIPVLTTGQIGEAAKAASDFADKVIAAEQQLKTIGRAKKKQLLQSVRENANLSDQNKKEAEQLITTAARMQSTLDKSVLAMLGALVKAGQAGLEVAEKSAAQYSKPGATQAAGPKAEPAAA